MGDAYQTRTNQSLRDNVGECCSTFICHIGQFQAMLDENLTHFLGIIPSVSITIHWLVSRWLSFWPSSIYRDIHEKHFRAIKKGFVTKGLRTALLNYPIETVIRKTKAKERVKTLKMNRNYGLNRKELKQTMVLADSSEDFCFTLFPELFSEKEGHVWSYGWILAKKTHREGES